jgi:hypothetical protein
VSALVDEPEDGMPSPEELAAAIRSLDIGPLLLSTVSTLASVAYGKLEAGDLAQARTAIDAMAALMPVLEGQVEAAFLKDFAQALANLRLAYADTATRSQ